MRNHARCIVLQNEPNRLVIKDIGPWDQYPTVTNDAEWVVEQLANCLHGRTLLYMDSEGTIDQLVVVNGKFAGFAPGLGIGEKL
jgi:hypothetical protein